MNKTNFIHLIEKDTEKKKKRTGNLCVTMNKSQKHIFLGKKKSKLQKGYIHYEAIF